MIALRQSLPKNTKDMVGAKVGALTVVRFAGSENGALWECRCACGKLVTRTGSSLRAKKRPSCGCVVPTETHGMSKTALYQIYWNMRNRCENSKTSRWARYGGRGIRVCPEWQAGFEAFASWAGTAGYQPGLSIDRIDNDAGYSPQNCRWVSSSAQSRNRSITRRLDWNGESLTPREWAEKLQVPYDAIQLRVTRGWTVERIFTQPFRAPR